MNSFIYDIPTKVYFGENQLGRLANAFVPLDKNDVVNILKMCL